MSQQIRTEPHTHTKKKNKKTEYGNYDAYPELLSKKWINGRSRKHLAYTTILSEANLPKKLQHSIL